MVFCDGFPIVHQDHFEYVWDDEFHLWLSIVLILSKSGCDRQHETRNDGGTWQLKQKRSRKVDNRGNIRVVSNPKMGIGD